MTTIRNSALINELSADLLPRNDALNRMAGLVSAHLAIPGLRALWPMSSVAVNIATDVSSQGRFLTGNGTLLFGHTNLIPYARLVSASSQYLNRTDEAGLQPLGTETYIEVAYRGLTLGGWFNLTALSGGTARGLMSKWNTTGNQRSYLLQLNTTDNPAFAVSSNGTAVTAVTHTTTMATGSWYHIVARYMISTSLDIWVNGEKVTNTTSIPASIFDNTTDFEIGRFNASNTTCADMICSMNFLSVEAMSDAWVFALYEQGRSIFDV